MTKRRRTVDTTERDDADTLEQEARDTSVQAALERVLAHAESHGEAYPGAAEDHEILRAAIEEGELPGDQRAISKGDDGDGA